jgi:hypothetical protein
MPRKKKVLPTEI